MRRDPSIILKAPALVPSEQHAADGHTDNDYYVFAFLAGLTAASQSDIKKVIETKQPYYLVHVMPGEWRKPARWNLLAPLTLKSDSEEEMLVEISGQDEGRGFITRVVNLPPKTKVVVEDSFYSLAAVHIKHPPKARIGIHNAAHKEVHLIPPMDWGNVWVYGMEIYLAGYVSRREFSQHANNVYTGTRVFQYEKTRVKNLAMPVSALKSLRHLFSRLTE